MSATLNGNDLVVHFYNAPDQTLHVSDDDIAEAKKLVNSSFKLETILELKMMHNMAWSSIKKMVRDLGE